MSFLDIFKKKKPVQPLPNLEQHSLGGLPKLKPGEEPSVLQPAPSGPPPEMHPAPIPQKPAIPIPAMNIPKPAMHSQPVMPAPPKIPAMVTKEVPLPQKVAPSPAPRMQEPIMRKPTIKMPPAPEQGGMILPSYMKVDDFKEMLGGIQITKQNLKECDEIFSRLNQLKNDEDKEFEKWRSKLEDLQRKLIYVDKVLFEAKGET
tara:strand:- start:1977 stop:2585 length:609 start_codon:yes stop_codon:yes gene_type:complete